MTHESVCLSVVLAAQWSGVSIWLDRRREGGEGGREDGGGADRAGPNSLLPAVSSLTLHFLPTHTLAGTAAITAQQPQEHKTRLISLTNQPAPFTPLPAAGADSHCVRESRP